jgi:hypothetical protein
LLLFAFLLAGTNSGTARAGGFFAAVACAVVCFSAMLFFKASIKSMTGASWGWATAVISWPFSLASIILRTLS